MMIMVHVVAGASAASVCLPCTLGTYTTSIGACRPCADESFPFLLCSYENFGTVRWPCGSGDELFFVGTCAFPIFFLSVSLLQDRLLAGPATPALSPALQVHVAQRAKCYSAWIWTCADQFDEWQWQLNYLRLIWKGLNLNYIRLIWEEGL